MRHDALVVVGRHHQRRGGHHLVGAGHRTCRLGARAHRGSRAPRDAQETVMEKYTDVQAEAAWLNAHTMFVMRDQLVLPPPEDEYGSFTKPSPNQIAASFGAVVIWCTVGEYQGDSYTLLERKDRPAGRLAPGL